MAFLRVDFFSDALGMCSQMQVLLPETGRHNPKIGFDRPYPVLYLLGLVQIAVYFVVFTALIKALDLPTPGRRPEEPVRPETAPLDDAGVEKLIAALGGRENICTVDNCFTRLRVTVQDAAFVREQALRELPCSGVVQNGCNVQIVFGIRAPQVRQAV